ncbi:tetratricopeptide repeat protein [Actinosynnema sp. NPDC051121]
MDRQPVYIVHAEGEESQAELLAHPLREAGYDVTHNGTVVVGESLIGSAMRAVTGGAPIVLCATARATGSAWAHQIVNAGHADGPTRVFVVQMERQAYVEHLALRRKVARYCDDPTAAVRDLLTALAKHFPPTTRPAPARVEWVGEPLDAPTGRTDLDLDAVRRFRNHLRPEVVARHPAGLQPWEFLERAGLVVDDALTATGVLLFGRNPTAVFPAAVVKCVRYHGPDRAATRDAETFEGPVPEQIAAARDFIARHVRRGEHPSPDQARSVDVHDYPMIAVREMIANALVHRDYGTADICVHVRVFQDRLEISSPGAWPGREIADGDRLSLADLDGQSIKRNFRLAHVLSWVRLVEGEGSGIPTSLRDCAKAEAEPPTVRYDQGVITVTLRPRPPDPVRTRRDVVPRQLPSRPRSLIGRDEEFRRLSDDPEDGTTTITSITGMPGIGKTTLAVFWANRHRDRFPDGMLYVDLRGFSPHVAPLDPAVVLRRFLLDLGLGDVPTDPDALTSLYRSLLADKRLLIILDNAADSAQVRPLLPGAPHCRVLITSRVRLTGLILRDGARNLAIAPLRDAESHALLVERIGPERVAAEPEAVDQVLQLCGGHPLALSIMAVRINEQPAGRLSDFVADVRASGVASLGLGEMDVSFAAVLSWSMHKLDTEPRRVFTMLGIAPGLFVDVAAGAALTGLPPARTRAAFDALENASLLTRHPDGHYSMHDLVRTYAEDLSRHDMPTPERVAAARRVVDFYARAARTAHLALDPRSVPESDHAASPEDAKKWFVQQSHNLLATQRTALSNGWYDVVCELAETMTAFHRRNGLTDDDVHVWQLAADAAGHLDPPADITAHRNLGVALTLAGRHEQALAHLRRALATAQEVDDPRALAAVHRAIARVLGNQDDDRQALDHAVTAAGLSRRLGDPAGEADALGDIGRHAARLGDHAMAFEHCVTALELHRAHANTGGAADTLKTLGHIAQKTERYHDALAHYSEALALYRELDDERGVADVLDGLGHAYAGLDRFGEARAVRLEAVELYAAQNRVRQAEDLRRLLDTTG